jgi:hypothetical protein
MDSDAQQQLMENSFGETDYGQGLESEFETGDDEERIVNSNVSIAPESGLKEGQGRKKWRVRGDKKEVSVWEAGASITPKLDATNISLGGKDLASILISNFSSPSTCPRFLILLSTQTSTTLISLAAARWLIRWGSVVEIMYPARSKDEIARKYKEEMIRFLEERTFLPKPEHSEGLVVIDCGNGSKASREMLGRDELVKGSVRLLVPGETDMLDSVGGVGRGEKKVDIHFGFVVDRNGNEMGKTCLVDVGWSEQIYANLKSQAGAGWRRRVRDGCVEVEKI